MTNYVTNEMLTMISQVINKYGDNSIEALRFIHECQICKDKVKAAYKELEETYKNYYK